MRAHEIMEDISSNAQAMLTKLRKGMAASLNAARFNEILPALPGWQIAKVKLKKSSDGGWLIKEVPGSNFYQKYPKEGDDRIHYTAHYPNPNSDENYQKKNQLEVETLKNTIYPKLVALSKTTQKKWNIRDVTMTDRPGKYSEKELDISFDFIVDCSGFLLTAPDGQTYEVYGDYKNGARYPHTFEKFFHWAVENTDIMDQINAALGTEPHEAKIDPRKPYTPPPTASEETKKVHELFLEMTNGVRDEQYASLLSEMHNTIAKYQAALDSDDEQTIKILKSSMPVSRSYNRDNVRMPDWEKTIESMCQRQVEEMQNMFVYKNTRKLSSILTAKGSIGSPKVLHIDGNRGVITARISFKFDDGSSFVVEQSIVRSYTHDSWGRVTDFYRFPTTFHNVVLPDGTKMKQPSEEAMNEIFVKA